VVEERANDRWGGESLFENTIYGEGGEVAGDSSRTKIAFWGKNLILVTLMEEASLQEEALPLNGAQGKGEKDVPEPI